VIRTCRFPRGKVAAFLHHKREGAAGPEDPTGEVLLSTLQPTILVSLGLQGKVARVAKLALAEDVLLVMPEGDAWNLLGGATGVAHVQDNPGILKGHDFDLGAGGVHSPTMNTSYHQPLKATRTFFGKRHSIHFKPVHLFSCSSSGLMVYMSCRQG
jgi:hypothetical protein